MRTLQFEALSERVVPSTFAYEADLANAASLIPCEFESSGDPLDDPEADDTDYGSSEDYVPTIDDIIEDWGNSIGE